MSKKEWWRRWEDPFTEPVCEETERAVFWQIAFGIINNIDVNCRSLITVEQIYPYSQSNEIQDGRIVWDQEKAKIGLVLTGIHSGKLVRKQKKSGKVLVRRPLAMESECLDYLDIRFFNPRILMRSILDNNFRRIIQRVKVDGWSPELCADLIEFSGMPLDREQFLLNIKKAGLCWTEDD